MHSSRKIVNTWISLWPAQVKTWKECFSGRKWPSSGGNCCFKHHHKYYSWYQRKIEVLGSSHKWTGNGPLASLVRLLLDHSGNILDRLSNKLLSSFSLLQLLSFIIAYNRLIKRISGANRWFKSTTHFFLQQRTSILSLFQKWASFSLTLLPGQPALLSP